MDNFESDIATYLTIDGKVFIAPQFNIKWEMNEGGSCPDFVALDFSCSEVVVVEVTAADDWHPLERRVRQRNTRWFNPVHKRLLEQRIITPEWRVRFLGFMRRDAKRRIERQFVDVSDVTFYALEDAVIPWLYPEDRQRDGLPGNRRKLTGLL